MATKDIAIACQGGGSRAAFTAGVLPTLMTQFANVRVAQSGSDKPRQQPDLPNLVGISGTSGGAISALLGWYGFITGGPDEAERCLNQFWDSNCAHLPGEQLVNFCTHAYYNFMSAIADMKYSPYTAPLAPFAAFFNDVWPQLAQGNPFMRPDYFRLPELIRPCVDFELVEAFGAFASIPFEVSRWLEGELETTIFAPDAPCQRRYHANQMEVERRIGAHLAAAQTITQWIEQHELAADALLRVAFDNWHPPALRFDHDSLEHLASAVQDVTCCIPTLLLGAVELEHGHFIAFSSERAPDDGGVSLDAVMASAALPWLFKAKRVRGIDPVTREKKWYSHWDGLFSQNPPIKNFLSGVLDGRKKPDEILIIQISPNEASARPGRQRDFPNKELMAGEIWELRDSLAGNISLNQELDFVEAINKRLYDGGMTTAKDKPIRVDRIIMDGDAVDELAGAPVGVHAGMDRSLQQKDALLRHGADQAQRFLTLREKVDGLFSDLPDMLGNACRSVAGPEEVVGVPDRIAATEGSLMVEELILHRYGEPWPDNPQALVRWRAKDATVNGTPVRLEGESELYAHVNPGADWRLVDVRITSLAPTPRHAVTLPASFTPLAQPIQRAS
jgi:predicted acylesterase/phospholipase RssA